MEFARVFQVHAVAEFQSLIGLEADARHPFERFRYAAVEDAAVAVIDVLASIFSRGAAVGRLSGSWIPFVRVEDARNEGSLSAKFVGKE
ncbi:MAG: hypothetical protein NVSMB64_20110 [Candidatus Velthaea sp.]